MGNLAFSGSSDGYANADFYGERCGYFLIVIARRQRNWDNQEYKIRDNLMVVALSRNNFIMVILFSWVRLFYSGKRTE